MLYIKMFHLQLFTQERKPFLNFCIIKDFKGIESQKFDLRYMLKVFNE